MLLKRMPPLEPMCKMLRLYRNRITCTMRTAAFISAIGLGISACATRPSVTESEKTGDARSGAEAFVERLTNADNGLEIRRWSVVSDDARLLAVLDERMAGIAGDDLAQARLQRNGFRFVRVPGDELELLLHDLGGSNVDRSEWHGQIPEWRTLIERPLDQQGQAVAIDGRVRRFDRGTMRLMIRSWTVQMETGPAVHLEVLPSHHLPDGRSLQRLLGAAGSTGEGFDSMTIDLQLEAGWGYVVIGQAPDTGSARLAPGRNATASRGPQDAAGPDAAAPLTMGEFLLGQRPDAARRTILVFVARVPAELFIPVQEEANEATGLNAP